MQEYDIALKLLLQGSAKLTMRELTGTAIEKWLNVELPKVQNRRMDLLGETADGSLVHLELHSGNEAAIPLRMAEYCLGAFRLFGRFPRQILLYVGEVPMRMETELRGPDVSFRYRAIDIRDLDGDRLLESEDVGDNVIAILARLRDHKEAVRQIVERIAGLAPAERETALGQLLILAGLRSLESVIGEESAHMPVIIDLMENRLIKRYFLQGKEEGKQEGRAEGEQEGARKEVMSLLTRLLERRFGPLPKSATRKLKTADLATLEAWSLRLLDAATLEEVLQSA